MTATTRMVKANGLDMQIVEDGKGPLVILCHGWPELSYSWRHQIPALAAAGYRVVAPDMRGYGGTSAPEAIDAYTIHHLVGDIVALVAALGERQAIIVGHDWGANVAWHCAMFRPDVFPAVCAMSVPLRHRGPKAPMTALSEQGITTFYWQYFQTPGVVEAEFARNWDFSMRAIYYGTGLGLTLKPGRGMIEDATIPEKTPSWISDGEMAHYVKEFSRTGLRGGINWYRNLDRNWALTAPWQDAKIAQPSFFIAGARDPVITGLIGERALKTMDELLPGLRGKTIIEGAGHWIQQEKPAQVNAELLGFLKGL
ncbi:MAG: alpha/beta hydrolase [Hyphomicrobiales bacterium]|nr:alpha/beta hydrolase [Hyphomicrobiales bacterium]